MRICPLGMMLVCAAVAGCHGTRSKEPKPVGSDLPVTSSSSVALPGATDAADAPRSPSVAESKDAGLTTYRDSATGVSFRYPAVWRPVSAAQVLPVPAFASVAGAPRITQAFSPEGNVYAPTVLRALSFSYTAKEGRDAASCAALPRKATPNETHAVTATYGGVPYTEALGGDAGMCTHVSSQVDSTLRGSQCLVFERDFVTGCPYVKNKTLPRPLTDQETAALQRHLDAVMQSVQILPEVESP